MTLNITRRVASDIRGLFGVPGAGDELGVAIAPLYSNRRAVWLALPALCQRDRV